MLVGPAHKRGKRMRVMVWMMVYMSTGVMAYIDSIFRCCRLFIVYWR